MIKKSLTFILARAIPGLITLLTIMMLTRLLSPQIYGQYAVIFSLCGLLVTICFQWMQFSLLRFYPKNEYSKEQINAHLTITFFIVALTIVPLYILLIYFSLDYLSIPIALMCYGIILGLAFFDLACQCSISQGDAKRYGWLMSIKSILVISMSYLLIIAGWQLTAPLSALLCVYLAMSCYLFVNDWHFKTHFSFDWELLKRLLQYGLPLSFTFILNYLMANTDRLMLAWLNGEASAGLYAAAYDLCNFSFIVLMLSLHLAFYPQLVQAFENKQKALQDDLLSQNFQALLLIAIVPALLFGVLSTDIAELLLGESFVEVAGKLMPLIALASFLLGLKAYYFDLVFLLLQRTKTLLWIGLIGAASNLLLNYLWIPLWQESGAALATLSSYLIILSLSFVCGRKLFSLPLPLLPLAKLLLLMAICWLCVVAMSQMLNLWFGITFILSLLIGLIAVYLLDILNSRQWLSDYLQKTQGQT